MGNALSIRTAYSQLDYQSYDPDAAADARLGPVVHRPTANLPQSTAYAIYTVSGGRILLTQIIGEVTTVIQTQACNTKLVFDPTAAGSDVDLCAVLDITAKAVGTLFGITGTLANALQSGLMILGQATPHILQPGTIKLDCAASNTGQVKWTARYVPIDVGARLAAA